MIKSPPKLFSTLNIALLASILTAASENSRAADITFLCAAALQPAMKELIREFQKASGHNVKVSYATISDNVDRIRKGDAADLAIVSPAQWDTLQKEGKLSPGSSQAVFAKVGIGVFVKKGAPRPDISSPEALKRTFLNAHSIAMSPPNNNNPVWLYAVRLFDKLGITAELNAKNQFYVFREGETSRQAVIKGDAEIGFTQISEVLAEPGVDFVGPMPAEVQNYTYTAATPANAKEPGAAKALIEFLGSVQGLSILKSKGLEPGYPSSATSRIPSFLYKRTAPVGLST